MQKKSDFKYIFGPVISRRLGISLGIDIVPPKTCSMNCIYCEAGKTTLLTTERKEFFPITEIKKEIRNFLSQQPEVDFLTFSGSGEPTLYVKLGQLIDWIKQEYPSQKICLLTNGILIGYNQMPQELKNLDLIIPSLDASDEISFQKINRPSPELTLEKLINSIKNFRLQNKCQMWLELFVIPGINDTEQSIANFAKIISNIKPDKIQLNGLDRPGTEKWIKKPDNNILGKFVNGLQHIAPVEIIVRQNLPNYKNTVELQINNISNLLSKRPCTIEEIKKIFSLNDNELNQIIQELISSGKFEIEENQSGKFVKRKSY